MKDGEVVGRIAGDEITEENILTYSIGGAAV